MKAVSREAAAAPSPSPEGSGEGHGAEQGGRVAMYKRQVNLQKILCFAAIAVSAMVFIYSLGIITDVYDSLYLTMRNPNDLTQTSVPGSIIYYDMQGFNQQLMLAGIGLILLSLLLFLTNTHVRRRYYIGNYVASGLYAVAALAVSIWGHMQIEAFKAQFLQIDFVALKAHADTWNTLYTESTFWFDVHYFVFALLIIVAALLVANVFWKISLMKQEAALLAAPAKTEGATAPSK